MVNRLARCALGRNKEQRCRCQSRCWLCQQLTRPQASRAVQAEAGAQRLLRVPQILRILLLLWLAYQSGRCCCN